MPFLLQCINAHFVPFSPPTKILLSRLSPPLWTPPSALSSPLPRRTSASQQAACWSVSIPKTESSKIFQTKKEILYICFKTGYLTQFYRNCYFGNLFSIWREANIWPASTSSPEKILLACKTHNCRLHSLLVDFSFESNCLCQHWGYLILNLAKMLENIDSLSFSHRWRTWSF